MSVSLIVILVIVAAIVLYIISTQRTLVSLDEFCKNALSQIGVQLTSRWDLVSALVKLIEKYSKYEHDTLVEVIAQRRGAQPPTTAEQINKQESAIADVLGRINIVSERYPELKASEIYQSTMASMNEYEEKVRKSRMVYNDSVTKMNRMVRQFPSSLVAALLHFGLREYLEVEDKKKDYPQI
jgi:LemA protein